MDVLVSVDQQGNYYGVSFTFAFGLYHRRMNLRKSNNYQNGQGHFPGLLQSTQL